MGRPKAIRVLAWSVASSRQARAQPSASAEMAMRPSSRVFRNCLNPWPGSPSRFAAGTRQLSNDKPCVSETCQPSLW